MSEEVEGTDLCAIIMAADRLNHSIPAYQEVSDAIGELYGCGPIEFRNDRVILTLGRKKISDDGFRRRGEEFYIIGNMRRLMWSRICYFSHPKRSMTSFRNIDE